MRAARIAALLVFGFTGLTAQTPAPPKPAAPAQAAGKVLRHLEFAFTVGEEGTSESHFNGNGGDSLRMSNGVGTYSTSDGGSGVMDIDVLGLPADGGLIVQISEWVHLEPRPRQSYVCEVYGNTTVICPTTPAPSQAEWVLLAYLGRQFVDAAPWDPRGHWSRVEKTPGFTVQEDFTRTATAQPNRVLVRETKKYEMHNGGFSSITESVDITYDRAMEIPTAVHDDVVQSNESGSEHDLFTFQLQHDSLAKS